MDRNVDFAAANAPGRVAAARIAAFEAASSAVVHADADPAPARMQLIAAQRLSMPARPSGSDRPAFPLELSLRNELGRRADYSRVKRRIKGWPGNGSRIIKLRRDRLAAPDHSLNAAVFYRCFGGTWRTRCAA